jgi:methionyl-tRNA synthetase
VKTEAEAAGHVLADMAELLRLCASLLHPVMPVLCTRMLERLGAEAPARDGLCWKERGVGRIVHGDPLVPRMDEEAFLASLAPPAESTTADAPVPAAPGKTGDSSSPVGEGLIAFGDFGKVKLVAARILAAQPVKGADRVLQLSVDCGEVQARTIVAGIAADHAPESLPGRMICVVANLEPAKIRGILSQGMLLAAKGPQGLALLDPGPVPPGTPIG